MKSGTGKWGGEAFQILAGQEDAHVYLRYQGPLHSSMGDFMRVFLGVCLFLQEFSFIVGHVSNSWLNRGAKLRCQEYTSGLWRACETL
mmetsp:Transcript_39646/g.64400  ORF Transcript_39646/g.64400 Transcript_39646/m.64400 type:complete len:88 (-) Transcript_39646:214-477(-)